MVPDFVHPQYGGLDWELGISFVTPLSSSTVAGVPIKGRQGRQLLTQQKHVQGVPSPGNPAFVQPALPDVFGLDSKQQEKMGSNKQVGWKN